MFSMLRGKPKKANDGPYFLKGEQYPQGFQPLFPESSLRNALTVVRRIAAGLEENITMNAPASLTESERELWIADRNQCISIHQKINALIQEIQTLSGSSVTEILANQTAALQKVDSIVGAASNTVEGLNSPAGAQSIIALNALADVLHITRRSIPDGPALQDFKDIIAGNRNYVLTFKGEIEDHMLYQRIKTETEAVRAATQQHESGACESTLADSVADADADEEKEGHGLN